jgi:outer membrane protein OmpA-like peptidoglycan-associated protein
MKQGIVISLIALSLTACNRAPNAPTEPQYVVAKAGAVGAATGLGIGALTGASAGALVGTTVAGGAVGAVIGAAITSEAGQLHRLGQLQAQTIHVGDQTTIVLSTDDLFKPYSSKLTHSADERLDLVSSILSKNKQAVEIRAYADTVGDEWERLQLTHDQANTVLAYLWAHGIDLPRLHATGLGREPSVATNTTSAGSAYNRRVEITWRG